MSVLMTGLVHVFGPPSSGKTTFAVTASDEPEKKVCFLDGDSSKGKNMAEDLGIKNYYDLNAMWGDLDELEYHNEFLKLLNGFKDDSFDVLILDNSTNFFRGAHSYVDKNRSKFRKVWSPSGKYANMQVYTEMRKKHLPAVYTKMQRKAKLVIIITHLQDAYDDAGVKTGAQVAEADESLLVSAGVVIRMATNTRRNDFAPVGLLIKKYRPQFIPSERRVVNVFPDRLDPCTWQTIEYYLNNPVGLKESLDEHEIPDEFEVSLIRGSLTPEQQRVHEFNKQMALLRASEEIAEEVLALAVEMTGPLPIRAAKISEQLSETYPMATPSLVKNILSRSVEAASEGGNGSE